MGQHIPAQFCLSCSLLVAFLFNLARLSEPVLVAFGEETECWLCRSHCISPCIEQSCNTTRAVGAELEMIRSTIGEPIAMERVTGIAMLRGS